MSKQPVRWTTKARSILASAADIAGDWLYYKYFVDLDDDRVNNEAELRTSFLAFGILSTVFGIFSIAAVLGCKIWKAGNKSAKFLEMIVEDLPQLALTSYVTYQLGGTFSPRAVLNLTTSAYNFVFDVLDLCDLYFDADSSGQNEEPQPVVNDSESGSNKLVEPQPSAVEDSETGRTTVVISNVSRQT